MKALSRRYARALATTLTDEKTLSRVLEELEDFKKATTQSLELRQVLQNPTFSAVRRQVVEQILIQAKAHKTTIDFVLLLIERDRIAALPEIIESLRRQMDERSGIARAVLSSAWELSDSAVSEVSAALSQLTGKKIAVERKVDPRLLGGMVASIGSQVFDGSLASQLERLKEKLSQA